jgi:probable HAF family extracellular repeat protein
VNTVRVEGRSTRFYDVSGDGGVGTGAASGVGFSGTDAFNWTPTTGSTALPSVGPGGSYAVRLSRTGAFAVGANGDRAALWGPGGVVSLGNLTGVDLESDARGVSADGSVVVGRADTSSTTTSAFRWTAAGGMQAIPTLPGYAEDASAYDVSADGSTIVGGMAGAGAGRAFRWTAMGGTIDLGVLRSDHLYSVAESVSADGSVIIGESQGSPFSEAFVWTADRGMVGLRDLLDGMGVASLNGWSLVTADSISSDGRFIVGTAVDPDLHLRAYVATIPSPGTLILVGVSVAFSTLHRRRSACQ